MGERNIPQLQSLGPTESGRLANLADLMRVDLYMKF